ncbi:unnamed protein product [marine sediment metagenome]|uniref:Uncharacterized protein n=1 Tax=marine sediment metagenome TaxID=412755 RepID=X0XC67_9ZZZZ
MSKDKTNEEKAKELDKIGGSPEAIRDKTYKKELKRTQVHGFDEDGEKSFLHTEDRRIKDESIQAIFKKVKSFEKLIIEALDELRGAFIDICVQLANR